MNLQKGSVHVIIIISLVLLLVGSLGFIYWQNFSKSPHNNNHVTEVKKNDPKKSDAFTDQMPAKTLNIAEWGIKIPASGSLSYNISQSTFANIKSDELIKAQLAINCTEDNGVTVYRTASLDDVGPIQEKYVSNLINGHYYLLEHGSQALCVDSAGNGDKVVNDAYETLFNQLGSAWKSVTKI